MTTVLLSPGLALDFFYIKELIVKNTHIKILQLIADMHAKSVRGCHLHINIIPGDSITSGHYSIALSVPVVIDQCSP